MTREEAFARAAEMLRGQNSAIAAAESKALAEKCQALVLDLRTQQDARAAEIETIISQLAGPPAPTE